MNQLKVRFKNPSRMAVTLLLEDIAPLKERLKDAETMVEWYLEVTKKRKTKIDSYRRLLAASLS
jgi:hypothetical protein